jgi:hypothetical protein
VRGETEEKEEEKESREKEKTEVNRKTRNGSSSPYGIT